MTTSSRHLPKFEAVLTLAGPRARAASTAEDIGSAGTGGVAGAGDAAGVSGTNGPSGVVGAGPALTDSERDA